MIEALQIAQSALDAAGAASARIERIWWLLFWVTAVVFVLTMAFVAAAVVLRRERRPEPPVVDTASADAAMTPIVAVSVAVTAVILFVFLVASVWASRGLATVGAASAVTIDVTGHQWWWEVEYEDPTPSLRVRTANELHIPVGQPVVLKVTSRDVIHSLWVPNLQGKRDLIPGYTTAVWMEADRPGVYRGQCAEFCGLQHAHMALTVTAESNDLYQHWLSTQREEAAAPSTDAERRGRDVFLSATCTQCHTVRGTIAGATLGPDLTHLASRGTLGAATLPNTIGHLGGWIVDSQRIKPGNRMPPNSLGGSDLQALLSYLESLK